MAKKDRRKFEENIADAEAAAEPEQFTNIPSIKNSNERIISTEQQLVQWQNSSNTMTQRVCACLHVNDNIVTNYPLSSQINT